MIDRPRKPHGPHRRGPGRRQPPPDDTGRAVAMYRELLDRKRPVTVRTTDGERHRGTLVGFDDDHLELRSADGRASMIRITLSTVRSIVAD